MDQIIYLIERQLHALAPLLWLANGDSLMCYIVMVGR